MTNPKQLRTVGTDVCQPCAISGNDGDACRANKLDDGGVFCITCSSISQPISANARAIYQMPMSVKIVVAALLRSDIPDGDDAEPLTASHAQYGPDNLTPDRAAAAYAQGHVDVVLGAGRVNFSTVQPCLAHVVVSFQYDEVKSFHGQAFDKNAIAADEADLLVAMSQRSCPPSLVAAARKLIKMGFVVLHVDLDSFMRRVSLCHTLGAPLDRRIPRGIFAEVNYVV
jgi:hypothetical protein